MLILTESRTTMANSTNTTCDYDNCPVIFSLNMLSKKWLVPIMCALNHNVVMRFGELSRALGNVTDMMLTQCLKELQRLGIVNRVQYNEMPLRVEYSLTELGQEMVPSILSLSRWSPQILNEPADNLSCPHIECSAKVEHTIQLRKQDVDSLRRNWDKAYETIYNQLSSDNRYAYTGPLEKMVIVAESVLAESEKAGEEMSRLATIYYIIGTEKSEDLLSEGRIVFRIFDQYLTEARTLGILTDEMTNKEIIHTTLSFLHGLNSYWELERGRYDIVARNHTAIVRFFNSFRKDNDHH